MMMMMMMMMNCFCGMADRRKVFSLISSRDHCQRSSPSWISGSPRAGFKPAQSCAEQKKSLGFVAWSCAVVITTTPRHQKSIYFGLKFVCHQNCCVSLTLKIMKFILWYNGSGGSSNGGSRILLRREGDGFYFVKIFHFVEIQPLFYLYLQNRLGALN